MSTLYKICLVLSIVGCLNWGLVGLFDFNLVELLFGEGSLLTRIVYDITSLLSSVIIKVSFNIATEGTDNLRGSYVNCIV